MTNYEKGWTPEMSLEETKNLAYWERNMLALMLATMQEKFDRATGTLSAEPPHNGWYTHGEWDGWSRVISIDDGYITFHVPDDFKMGNLPEIEQNWDGHTTQEKWERIAEYCGVKL